MAKRLRNFFNTNNLFFEHQYGFQPGSSTELAVIDLHSQIMQLKTKKLHVVFFLTLQRHLIL